MLEIVPTAADQVANLMSYTALDTELFAHKDTFTWKYNQVLGVKTRKKTQRNKDRSTV